MQSFARVTKLHNIAGRADYISDPARQEEILVNGATDAVQQNGWQPVAAFEQANRKSAQKNNEGREVIVELPNDWAVLDKERLFSLAAAVANAAVGREMPYMEFAVHWNHARTNLHLHIIFSEREPLQGATAKRYDRDIYHTSDGKVARKRADRARDGHGNELPPVHRKGELVNPAGFGPKLTEFKAKGWPEQARNRAAEQLRSFGVDVQQREKWFLHEYHQGKGPISKDIAATNAGIRAYNACIAFLTSRGLDNAEVLKTLYRASQADLRAHQPPRVHTELWKDPQTRRKVENLCTHAIAQYSQQQPQKSSLHDRMAWAKAEAARQNTTGQTQVRQAKRQDRGIGR